MRGGSISKLTCVVLSEFSPLHAIGLRASVPHWLLSWGLNSLPCDPLHRRAHSMTAGFPDSKQAREREKVPKVEATVLCNLISKVTSIVFVLFYSLGDRFSPFKKKGFHNDEYCRGVTVGHLRVAYHTGWWPFLSSSSENYILTFCNPWSKLY